MPKMERVDDEIRKILNRNQLFYGFFPCICNLVPDSIQRRAGRNKFCASRSALQETE